MLIFTSKNSLKYAFNNSLKYTFNKLLNADIYF